MLEQVENKLTIRSVYKVTKADIEPVIIPHTGRYADCVRRVNSVGDMILNDDDRKSGKVLIGENERIEIYDGKTFDLDDPFDAAWWEAIKYSKMIAKDRSERDARGKLLIDGDTKRYGTAEFFVERPGQIANSRNLKSRAVHRAKDFIYKDNPDSLYQKARLLGSTMTGLPLSEVEDYLIDIATRTPNKIEDLYTGGDTHLRLLFLDALDKKVIFNKNKVYIYGDSVILGATADSVVLWMRNPDNKRLLEEIKKETYPEYYLGVASADLRQDEIEAMAQEKLKTQIELEKTRADIEAKQKQKEKDEAEKAANAINALKNITDKNKK